jgi:hypothetical protein
MASEGEGARRARERMRHGIATLMYELRPELEAQRDREQAAIEKAVAEDQHGYVWWHHWEPRSRRRDP